MADATKVFNFQIDGVDTAIADFTTLGQVVSKTEDVFSEADTTIVDTGEALEKTGKEADSAAKDFEKLGKVVAEADAELAELTASEKAAALGELGNGLAGALQGGIDGLKAFGIKFMSQ